jgi:hypothetical protein
MKRKTGSIAFVPIAFVPIAFVSVTLIFLLTACATPESEQLRKDNLDLKSQLEVVTQERDALKSQIETIRKALEAPSLTPEAGAITPDPGAPETSTDPSTRDSKSDALPAPDATPATPDSSGPNTAPVMPEKPLVPDRSGTPESAPQSNLPVAPPPVAPLPDAAAPVTTSPLYKYAAAVVQAATNYRLNSQQNPPSECSLGYSAGATVERSIQVKRCEVQALENNQYRVRVEGIDGSVVIVP